MSLADVIVLELHFGRKSTVELIGALDPWCYPDETSKASIGIKGFSQQNLDKAKSLGRNFADFTEESKTTYLLSAFLTRERPALLRPSLAGKARLLTVPADTRPESIVDSGLLSAHVLLPATIILAAPPGN